jgi:hypothetical protein
LWSIVGRGVGMSEPPCRDQGCQMVYFQTKNSNLGKFCRALNWKMLIYFMVIWNILRAFGMVNYCLVHFMFIWYIFPVLVSCTKKNLASLVGTGSESFYLSHAVTQILISRECHRAARSHS